MRYSSGNHSFYKSKNHGPNLQKTGFWYLTLPLFLFMLAYRTAECVLHKKLDRESAEKVPDEKDSRAGCRIIDRSTGTSKTFSQKRDDAKTTAAVPLDKEPVKSEVIHPVSVGEPAGRQAGGHVPPSSVTITEGL